MSDSVRARGLLARLQTLGQRLSDDHITIYAAQASFFVVISAMPFLSLVISIISFFLPADMLAVFQGYSLPEAITNIIGSVLIDLQSVPKISLLSFSAIATFWSSSKGATAIRNGIRRVYHAQDRDPFWLHWLKSLVYTLVFLVLILVSVVLLLFGNFLLELLDIPLLTRIVKSWRTPFVAAYMCAIFTAMYASAARRSTSARKNILFHLPGAVFATVGWTLFSFCYSLYITYFPNASYIYGSLAALCLIMLWLYFCMIILLLGAELNQLVSQLGKRRQEAETANV